MKHSKDRLTPRERAASAFLIAGILALACSGDKPYIWIPALLTGLVCWLISALILNWPEIKESLKKENAPSRAGTRTRRREKLSTYRLAESEEKVNEIEL